MAVGPHVFGDNRRGLWVAENANLTDKLKHFLPRLRGPIPNLTDLFLPPSAGIGHADQVRQAGFYAHMYDVAHGRTPFEFARAALARRKAQGTGALELDFEGSAITDANLAGYIQQTVAEVRRTNPNLPLRINVVPWKGVFLGTLALRKLVAEDDQLFIIVQAYGGNMDELYAADDVYMDVLKRGFHASKVSIQHAVMCRAGGSAERNITLPGIRNKGSLYIDDLLLDAGFLG
jgi:hypothetical protein